MAMARKATMSNKNYRCYGAEVLAVSSATVLSVKDGITDNEPDASARAVLMTWESVSGNHVVLDLGIGRVEPLQRVGQRPAFTR
jgi:hypothetical protein